MFISTALVAGACAEEGGEAAVGRHKRQPTLEAPWRRHSRRLPQPQPAVRAGTVSLAVAGQHESQLSGITWRLKHILSVVPCGA